MDLRLCVWCTLLVAWILAEGGVARRQHRVGRGQRGKGENRAHRGGLRRGSKALGLREGGTVQDYICNQRFTGYQIDYKRRKCRKVAVRGQCTNPLPYTTLRECRKDFKGKGNVCASGPCKHGGECMAVTTLAKGRTFKCDCSNTGFYGKRCTKRCPTRLSKKHSKQTACIRIG